jgi:hypothetical protein
MVRLVEARLVYYQVLFQAEVLFEGATNLLI